MGPYEPDSCKEFLKGVCVTIRTQCKYTAFLLDELSLPITPDESYRGPARLSVYNVFVIPKKCGSYGWVSELTEQLDENPSKLLIYYGNKKDIPFQVYSKMVNKNIKHGAIIDYKKTEVSFKRIATRITTAFFYPS